MPFIVAELSNSLNIQLLILINEDLKLRSDWILAICAKMRAWHRSMRRLTD